MAQVHKCSICSKSDVKLYRPYGEFLREETIRCNQHVPEKKLDWYVPMIEEEDGSVWGYTSIPEDAIEQWKALPDSSETAPRWVMAEGKMSLP